MEKIWERHKKKVDFLPTSMKRNCWMVCVDCEKLWGRIETEFVHMVYGGSKAAVFICDNCLEKRKGESKEVKRFIS